VWQKRTAGVVKGPGSFVWNGCNAAGVRASAGMYIDYMEAVNPDGRRFTVDEKRISSLP
jgi:hypothetical protein